MPLLIDCYNVLHTDMPQQLAGLEEVALCNALANSKWSRERISVVCDGVVKPGGPAVSPVEEVDLVYSGPGRSADDVIIQMIDHDSAPRRLLVISSDREIQKAARRRRAKSWTSDRFIHELAKSIQSGSKTKSRSKSVMSDNDVRKWAEAFGLDPDEPVDPDDDWFG